MFMSILPTTFLFLICISRGLKDVLQHRALDLACLVSDILQVFFAQKMNQPLLNPKFWGVPVEPDRRRWGCWELILLS